MDKIYLVRRQDSFNVYHAFTNKKDATDKMNELNADLDDLIKAIEACDDLISFKSERLHQVSKKYYLETIRVEKPNQIERI